MWKSIKESKFPVEIKFSSVYVSYAIISYHNYLETFFKAANEKVGYLRGYFCVHCFIKCGTGEISESIVVLMGKQRCLFWFSNFGPFLVNLQGGTIMRWHMDIQTRGTAEHSESVDQEALSVIESVEKVSCSLQKTCCMHKRD